MDSLPKSSVPLDNHTIEIFLNSIDNFIFDCDGVLWRGNELIDGADKALEMLRGKGKKLFFVSNNSTNSREQYVKKFEKFGIKVMKDELISSSYATAVYLQSISFKKKVYVVGESGIGIELKEAGIEALGMEKDGGVHDFEEVQRIEVDSDIGAVFCGYDRNFNYYKMSYAYLCLEKIKDCLFIATNLDTTFPSSFGNLPGGGSICAPIITATGKSPLVMGKPEPLMLDILVQKYSLNRSRSCMVGDRLNTDISFGLNGGLTTLLVLTGISTLDELNSPSNSIHPHYYSPSIKSLIQI